MDSRATDLTFAGCNEVINWLQGDSKMPPVQNAACYCAIYTAPDEAPISVELQPDGKYVVILIRHVKYWIVIKYDEPYVIPYEYKDSNMHYISRFESAEGDYAYKLMETDSDLINADQCIANFIRFVRQTGYTQAQERGPTTTALPGCTRLVEFFRVVLEDETNQITRYFPPQGPMNCLKNGSEDEDETNHQITKPDGEYENLTPVIVDVSPVMGPGTRRWVLISHSLGCTIQIHYQHGEAFPIMYSKEALAIRGREQPDGGFIVEPDDLKKMDNLICSFVIWLRKHGYTREKGKAPEQYTHPWRRTEEQT